MPYADVCLTDRQACTNEWPTFRHKQDACGSVEVTLRDAYGKSIELDPSTQEVRLYAREWYEQQQCDMDILGEITDAAEGKVKFTVVREDTYRPGLYLGEIVIGMKEQSESSSSSSSGDADDCVLHRLPCYI